MPKRTLLLVLLFLVAIAATFVLAYRLGRQVRSARSAEEPIRPWMSLPFIAHVHHVPVDALFQAIHVEPHQPHDRRPLRKIAHDEKRRVDELIGELDAAIARERPARPGTPKAPAAKGP